jgi:hypothetical protein
LAFEKALGSDVAQVQQSDLVDQPSGLDTTLPVATERPHDPASLAPPPHLPTRIPRQTVTRVRSASPL